MTKEELMKRTGLSEENAEILKRTEQMLPMMAELAGADLFIDCMDKTDGIMFVAAQAGPKYMPSAYQKSVVGCALSKRTNRRFTGRSRRELLYVISKQ